MHDDGTGLFSRWARYGETPCGIVEENLVYMIELGVQTDAGYIGLNEDVLVTKNGVEGLRRAEGVVGDLWLVWGEAITASKPSQESAGFLFYFVKDAPQQSKPLEIASKSICCFDAR